MNISDYDRRQYERMGESVAAFEADELSLGNLISNLRELMSLLGAPQKPWIDRFRGEWWELEQIHAVALDRGTDSLAGEDGEAVRRAVAEMARLLDQLLKDTEPGHSA